MKRTINILTAFVLSLSTFAQAPKNVIVEHFTNTKCSICANKNPGFYSNLSNNPEILHIAYHPSSPYSSCLLNNHNVAENDGRANYYGVYGSTPKFLIQGELKSTSTNMSNSSVFTPYTGQVSDVNLRFIQSERSGSTVNIQLSIKAEASNTLGNQFLYMALVEDTIFYNSPNGESEHYDVFRLALTADTGDFVNVPATNGDSIIITTSATVHQDWDMDRMYPIAILQQSNFDIIQANKGAHISTSSSINNTVKANQIEVYPNPSNGKLYFSETLQNITVYNIHGIELVSQKNTNSIDLMNLDRGMYLIQINENLLKKVVLK